MLFVLKLRFDICVTYYHVLFYCSDFVLRHRYSSPSPLVRRRYLPDPPSAFNNNNHSSNQGSENTSPLVLQRFYHQQNQHYNLSSYPNAPSHYR